MAWAGFDPGVPPLVPSASKGSWRSWARDRKAGLDFETIGRGVGSAIVNTAVWHDSQSVLIYLAAPDEVDLEALMDIPEPRRFATTRTPERGWLTVHSLPAELEEHRYGFRQPVAGSIELDPDRVDLVLVPGLAFAVDGGRLGRGGGHYDQLLERIPQTVPRIGVVPAALVTVGLPTDDWDQPMTHLATDLGMWEVAAK